MMHAHAVATLIALTALTTLVACKEDVAQAPPAVTMTEDALSHFCQMNIAQHPGPKGQVHLAGLESPIFFAQVRDLVAYVKGAERDAKIIAIYVSDMGLASSWHAVSPDNWVIASNAKFVVNAGVAGGMGAPEIVPFAEEAHANSFVARYGGSIVGFDEIPDDAAIGAVDLDMELENPA